MFFIVAATRLGREHAQVLREPHDDIERTAAWSRWTFRLRRRVHRVRFLARHRFVFGPITEGERARRDRPATSAANRAAWADAERHHRASERDPWCGWTSTPTPIFQDVVAEATRTKGLATALPAAAAADLGRGQRS